MTAGALSARTAIMSSRWSSACDPVRRWPHMRPSLLRRFAVPAGIARRWSACQTTAAN